MDQTLPLQLAPHVLLKEPSASVTLDSGTFVLKHRQLEGTIQGELRLRWLPSTAIEFEGTYEGPMLEPGNREEIFLSVPDRGIEASVILSNIMFGTNPCRLRGVFRRSVVISKQRFVDSLRFHLVNFPEYWGSGLRTENGGYHSGRLQWSSPDFILTIDAISEADGLRKIASNDGGFVVSHVAELRGRDGPIATSQLEDLLYFLHLFLGFHPGAWTGPAFPIGFAGKQKVWEQLAAWWIDETRAVPTWMPQCDPFAGSDLFSGFLQKYFDQKWRQPLMTAIHWYVTANSPRETPETRIVLTQIALDMLAWVHLIEIGKRYTRKAFKAQGAAARLRQLLESLLIPPVIPQHFANLLTLSAELSAKDGADLLVRLRNGLVHAMNSKRDSIATVTTLQRYEAGQLSLGYLELVLLALSGYRGTYARRGWVGWKGQDETTVPWS